MRVLFAILCCMWAQLTYAQPATGSVVESYETTRLGLTIYPNDLAMVTEVRKVDIPTGISEVRFHGVSDMILPETAILQSFDGLRLEGNFNSDLISRATLLQKAVGQILTIRRMNPATGRLEFIDAELVSAAPSQYGIQGAVFKTKDGLESLQCSGLAESVLFSKIPENLNPIPVLSMLVSAEDAGEKEITLVYLTRGIGWAADYRMDVKEGKDDATLLGWLTLSNGTSKIFKDVGVAVVAGNVNRAPQYNKPHSIANANVFSPTCGDSVRRQSHDEIVVSGTSAGYAQDSVVVQEASTELFAMADGTTHERAAPAVTKQVSVREATREELGDYKLYRAPQSVTVNAHQTKQIAFLLKPDIEFDKVYKRTINFKDMIDALTDVRDSRIEYKIDNELDGNLAQPLPRGTLRVMSERKDGHIVFTGEDKVNNLAVDVPFDVDVADSFLVTTVFDFKPIDEVDNLSLKLSTSVLNAHSAPVTAEIEFTELLPSVIGNSNFNRDTEEALATFRFPVSPQSKETLDIEIPLQQEISIEHIAHKYSNKSNSQKYTEAYYDLAYKFNDGRKISPDITRLLHNQNVDKLKVTAVELSREKAGRRKIERDEEFTFENLTSSPLKIQFKILKDVNQGSVEIVESSLARTTDDPDVWEFSVPANSEFVLSAKTRARR